jgi:hypothetical protein
MKKIYTLLIALLLVPALFSTLQAQDARIVTIPGFDPASTGDIEDHVDGVMAALDADATERATNPNVIYELVRGHLYPMANRIVADFDLHMRAQDGDGPLPSMINWPKADGGYSDFFNGQKNMTFENLQFEGYQVGGGVTGRMIKAYGEGSRVIMKGCVIDGDRGSVIALMVDDIKLYMDDVIGGNLGHPGTVGGNGRLVDIRSTNSVDTIIIKNTTTYNMSDRVIRNMGPVINYIELDHVTALNVLGLNGGVQLGKAKTAIITNSVFANNIVHGDNPFTAEQTHPEVNFHVITLDTIYEDGHYEVRNNNIYWDQELLDVWAQIDSVDVPGMVTPLMLQAANTTLEEAVFSEPLVFESVCPVPAAFIAAYYANPAATDLPPNWCVGAEGGLFPDQIDVSYANTYDSYTASDLGYPVGDLNYFPAMKESWLQGTDITSVDNIVQQESIVLYPNPVKEVLYINMEADELIIYNILGKQMIRTQNAESVNISQLPTGIYTVQVRVRNNISSQKIMVQ